MADLKKVIKGMECCGYRPFMDKCDECPYDGKECFQRLKDDALELLKAQEPKRMHWICGEDDSGQAGVFCSACGGFVPWYYDDYDSTDDLLKYCPHCGGKDERRIGG